MPNRIAFVSLCAFLTVLALPAEAQFAANYTAWQRLSPGERAGFVQGATDHLLVFVEDDPRSRTFSAAFHDCVPHAPIGQRCAGRGGEPGAVQGVEQAEQPLVGAEGFLANIRRNAAR